MVSTSTSMKNHSRKASEDAFVVRFGGIKSKLQKEAQDIDRSLNYLVVSICKDFLKKREAETKANQPK